MSTDFLLDASALLAVLGDEPGAERVIEILDRSAIHAVQLAEVVKKLVGRRLDQERCRALIERLRLPVKEGWSSTQAYATVPFCVRGLSLGDRICLAYAASTGITAVTADQRWAPLAAVRPGSVKVVMIR